MSATDWVGWCSSIVLLITIWAQIRKQWHDGTSRGVSWFLFIGQLMASIGFVTYSYLVDDLVFLFTNIVLLLSHLVGLTITFVQKRKEGSH